MLALRGVGSLDDLLQVCRGRPDRVLVIQQQPGEVDAVVSCRCRLGLAAVHPVVEVADVERRADEQLPVSEEVPQVRSRSGACYALDVSGHLQESGVGQLGEAASGELLLCECGHSEAPVWSDPQVHLGHLHCDLRRRRVGHVSQSLLGGLFRTLHGGRWLERDGVGGSLEGCSSGLASLRWPHGGVPETRPAAALDVRGTALSFLRLWSVYSYFLVVEQ